MSEFKPCHTCNQKECDFKHDGKDFVCSCGYVLTADDKQRMLHESYEAGIRNGEFSKLKPCPFKRITHTYTDGRAWIPATGVTFIGEGELVGPAIDRLALYEKLLQMEPAEAALMFRRAQPANEPLTLEQLKKMGGEPVYCSCDTFDGKTGFWCLCQRGVIVPPSCHPFNAADRPDWIFYLWPPERSNNE